MRNLPSYSQWKLNESSANPIGVFPKNELNSDGDIVEPKGYQRLWKKFVPDSGMADTVEGELLRATSRLIYRYFNDGDVYWKGYGLHTVASSVRFLTDGSIHPLGSELRKVLSDAKKNAPNVSQRIDDPRSYTENDGYSKGLQRVLDIVVDYVRKNEKDPTPNTYDSRMVSESLSPSWKSYAIGSEFVHGKLKFFHFKEGKHLVLTVMDGKYPEAWSIYYWNHGKPVGTDSVSRVVAATAARFDKGGDLDDGWTLGNGERMHVARWESRGKKYEVDLYHRGGPSYEYETTNGSGSFLAHSLEDAVKYMEKSAATSQPGRKGPETKMKRTK